MQAILKFNCSDESDEWIITVHAMDFALALFDLDQELREMVKHDDDNTEKLNGLDAIHIAREKLRDCMESHNISLDMIK